MENGAKSGNAFGGTATGTTKKRSNPNIFSRLFMWWVCPVLITGNKRDVEEEDLIVPNKKYDSDRLGEYLESYWFTEYETATRENREPKLWKAMARAYWTSYMPGALYIISISAIRSYQPMLFASLLSYWSVDSTMSRNDATFYALAMLGLNFLNMLCQHHNSLFVGRFGLKVKVAASSLLYRKLLRMSQVSVNEVAGGKLVNLLSNDVARFDFAFMFLHYLWVVPIQVAVVLYFLWNVAGYAPYVGLFSVVLFLFPVQAGLTKLTAIFRRETAQRTDKRIKLMSEIINGIQVIKMYAWEKPFQTVVRAARAYELISLKKSIFVRSVFMGFMLFTERTIMFMTCLVLVLSGTMVTATVIYPVQQYFSVIQMSLTLIIPFAIANLSEMFISLERIQQLLVMDEREDLTVLPITRGGSSPTKFTRKDKDFKAESAYIVPKKFSSQGNADGGIDAELVHHRDSVNVDYPIELTKINSSWTGSKETSELTLKNITLRMRRGKLCAIIGPVGSGKSSLLQLILRELTPSTGSLNVKGNISYACQDSWLFPASVRENILFGLPYDSKKYHEVHTGLRVIGSTRCDLGLLMLKWGRTHVKLLLWAEVCKACCLLPDFKQFPYADQSLVGERGVSLSGGQRARINLARAVYREADIYLLDDPLSAVDANVGRLLFEGCIKGYLRGRTVILVTHQIHYLKSADQIVVLNDGAIENVGSFDELVKSGKEFSLLLQRQESENDEAAPKKRPSLNRTVSKISNKGEAEIEEKVQTVEAEERAKGNLKWSVIGQYFQAVQSYFIVGLAGLSLILTQGAATTVDYWLSYWMNNVDAYEQSLAEGEVLDTNMDTQMGLLTTANYLTIYGCVVLAIIIFSQVRIFSFVTMAMRASANLHDIIYSKLIVTVMRFFDTNPSGRVLNRFSKDMGAMDEFMPRSMLETVQMYLSMSSILVLNAVALPWTLIPTFVLLVVFIFMLKWYLNAAQAVKRLEGTTKSPVFGMINSTISGLSTIRSANSQDRLLSNFDSAQDLHTSSFYTFLGGSTAFGLYLDSVCLVYLGLVMGLFIVVDFSSIIPVGSVGLAVSQSMVLTMLLQMAARFTADFLGQMTSVERILEYTKLPIEDNIDEGPAKPPAEWPSEGNINFESLFMKYGPEDEPVLKNLNVNIQSGWKVGVVGRTGAGKSSLISALFRLYDIEGSVKIDGIDTKVLAKKDLRSKISIIPQEPVLFSATLRYNLDPFDVYSDDDIWRALEQVELKDTIPALDFKVTEGGSNFSMGQRQLVCLARAVLRSNKLLIMDEATANVDPQTDALIQKTIRRTFTDCTVLTIAHRLNTIMDSDRVLVMDKGQAAEFDHPYLLLKNPNSILSFMVRETGESMSKVLLEVAKRKYESGQN